jgi:hypothetical protein
MTDRKSGWGNTVLGWFVVRDSESDPNEASTETSPTTAVIEPVGELPAAPGGVVDFDGVFSAFGINPEARERFAKGEGLLKTLPAGTDAAVKRQIVEASLKAFGVPFDQIIETACEEIQALDAYQRKGGAALEAFCDEAGKRITDHEQEIRSIRTAMEKEVNDQRKTIESCNRKKLEVQKVLEFFGPEAVGRVVRDSPKLIDPSAPGTAPGVKAE